MSLQRCDQAILGARKASASRKTAFSQPNMHCVYARDQRWIEKVLVNQNQQRRMLAQAATPAESNIVLGESVKEKPTRDEISELLRDVRAETAITMRSRVAARAAWRAVTGPCTAEYGPCNTGKKKIVKTHNAATTASLDTVWRLDIVRCNYIGAPGCPLRLEPQTIALVLPESSHPQGPLPVGNRACGRWPAFPGSRTRWSKSRW